MDAADFVFRLDDPTRPYVSVNGEEVTERVSRAAVDVRAGELPILHLEMAAGEGTVEGRGVVQVHHEAPDVEKAVEAWLRAIDPDTLEREALRGAGMGEQSTGRLFVNALLARARGEAPS